MGNEIVEAQPQAVIPRGNASTMVAQSREMAEAIGQMQMAKAFPLVHQAVAREDGVLHLCARRDGGHGAVDQARRDAGAELGQPHVRHPRT